MFNLEFVNEIATIISFGMKKLKFIKSKKKWNYKEFMANIQLIADSNFDIKNQYRKITNYDDPNLGEYILPNEIILLMNLFQGVKRIKMSLEDTTPTFVKGSLLVLLNYEWLFPFVFEIEFDLTCERLIKDIKEEYKRKLIDKCTRKLSDSSDTSQEEEKDNYVNIIKESSEILSLVIIYSYYISKFKYLNKLDVVFPHSFKTEIEENMKLNDMKVVDFHFLDFLLNINKLAHLSIEFNSLEREAFEKVLSIIQNNSQLKSLSINLFCKNEEYYTSALMGKIGEENGTNLKSVLNISEKIIKSSFNNENDGLDTKILNKLINDFETNLEKLFLLLQSKKNLDSLSIIFDLPRLISENEKYFMIFMKFLFNIFLMLNRERFHLKQLKIISPFLNFDSCKNLLIENFIEGINLNNKNKNLSLFHIQLQISSMLNISNIISVNLQNLFLGDLDLETFENFINFYQSEQFLSQSQLTSLSFGEYAFREANNITISSIISNHFSL